MQLEAWSLTDVGLKREINQDAVLVDHELGLYVVADGMGGHKGGEVASALAIETIKETIKAGRGRKPFSPAEQLTTAYSEASRRIHTKSTKENPELMGMGTTMVGALFDKGHLFIANVGDSRAYLLRGSRLWQLTEDHSLINEQLRAGVITDAEAPNTVGKNVITRSVGFEEKVNVDIVQRQVQKKDMFLLCSDGLSGMISDKTIAQICAQLPAHKVVSRCILEAKKAGGDDNISVILLRPKEPKGKSSG